MDYQKANRIKSLVVKRVRYVLPALYFSLSALRLFAQGGMAVNTVGAKNDPSAILDISSSTQGMLIPRVSLTSATSPSPITSPANKLIVYNTNASMVNGNGAGLYIYDSVNPVTGTWMYVAVPSNGPGANGQVLTSTGPSSPPAWTTASGVTSVTGNANQVTSAPTTGDVILSLPQDIDTGATPTFLAETLGLDAPSGTANTPGQITFASDGDDSWSTTLKAGVQTENINYVLPTTAGTANQLLYSDGNGNLNWGSLSITTVTINGSNPTNSNTTHTATCPGGYTAIAGGGTCPYTGNPCCYNCYPTGQTGDKTGWNFYAQSPYSGTLYWSFVVVCQKLQ